MRGDARPPSAMSCEPDDRILFVDTFSKNWAMTGWRIGWIEAPPALGQVIENLVQYSTSGVAAFIQRAGVAALDEARASSRHQIARARRGRDIVCDALGAHRARPLRPAATAPSICSSRSTGSPDVARLGLDLVDEANVGLAPGTAFGAGGEGFMRMCFLRKSGAARTGGERIVTLAPSAEIKETSWLGRTY